MTVLIFVAGLALGTMFAFALSRVTYLSTDVPVLVQLKDARFCMNCEAVYWDHGSPTCPGCGRFRETAQLTQWLKAINGSGTPEWKWTKPKEVPDGVGQ